MEKNSEGYTLGSSQRLPGRGEFDGGEFWYVWRGGEQSGSGRKQKGKKEGTKILYDSIYPIDVNYVYAYRI